MKNTKQYLQIIEDLSDEIGISKKDIMNTRGKPKNAFYNCFAIIIRIKHNNIFKEIHIKIFNTGKLEIPGIVDDDLLNKVKDTIIDILQPFTDLKIEFLNKESNNVLINSNFNCGFYINRELLFNILRNDYNINACYDPCSYPGIQCVYYFDNEKNCIIKEAINFKNIKYNQNITKVSYMLFRTGSILIVGKCSETILNYVYNYIKNILIKEYSKIVLLNKDNLNDKVIKSKKIKKKFIYTDK